jgi:hypothetical protein
MTENNEAAKAIADQKAAAAGTEKAGTAPASGVKEVKDVLVAANEVIVFILQRSKDGLKFEDVLAAFGSSDLKNHLSAAVAGIGSVKDELASLTLTEGLELAEVQLRYVGKIVDAMKAAKTA